MAPMGLGSELVGKPFPKLGIGLSDRRNCGRGGFSLHWVDSLRQRCGLSAAVSLLVKDRFQFADSLDAQDDALSVWRFAQEIRYTSRASLALTQDTPHLTHEIASRRSKLKRSRSNDASSEVLTTSCS